MATHTLPYGRSLFPPVPLDIHRQLVLSDATKFGVVLRFNFPTGDDLHVTLSDLFTPQVQHLLRALTSVFGTPVVLAPSLDFLTGFIREGHHG